MNKLLLGTLIGAGVLIPSIIGLCAYLKYGQLVDVESARIAQETAQNAVKVQQEKAQTDQLNFDRKTLLAEYDNCIAIADIHRDREWLHACDEQPWEKREDGICHLLPAHQVVEMDHMMTEEKNRCQDTYRNKMMALGIRQ